MRAGLTADRLAEAAADLADDIGFRNVTVSAVARGFGVADASVYSHVKNVGELRTRVARLAASDLADHVTAAVDGRVRGTALAAFAYAYREFALAHPGRYEAAQVRLAPDVAAGSAGHHRLVEVTYALLRARGLTEPDLTDAVRFLRSAFHGFVTLEAGRGFGHARGVQASWERTVAALVDVMEHWAAADGGPRPSARMTQEEGSDA
ncbi:TetR-like C-terminal domain-containing protein [Streptomyces sp. NPDC002537]